MKLYWKKAVTAIALIGLLTLGFSSQTEAATQKEQGGIESWLSQSLFDIQTQWIQIEDSQWASLLKELAQAETNQTAKPEESPAKEKPAKPKQQPSAEGNSQSKPASGSEKAATPSENESGSSVESKVSDIQPIEVEVVKLVNQEREQRGLKPLQADAKLSKVARDKSQDMIDNHYFSHDSPRYGSPFDMMKAYGISYRSAAENIAAGQTSAKQVVDGWMNSDGHRANILNPDLDTIGVGYAKGGSYGHYWTQMFIQR
ncbi:CAP domain-containing protein [Desmospora activa]|uniref:Putative YkwD family protein n=1 Tax=Desmospora activa DSM 45169 TaxID=1121389 RepID=A0A2T4ZAU0_9BACL|nr:CAP domain-containing protein [Desmospora activa]PTM59013.1 putative YkwD family protein [Desmospora activa DSM 45169]